MAKLNYLFGKARGSIGEITFSTWRKIPVAKKKIEKNGSNTPRQQKQRSAFMLVTKLVQPLNSILKHSFRPYTAKMTGYNACLAYNLKNALTEGQDGWEIDYSKVLVARGGKLLSPANANFDYANDSFVLEWDNNSNDIGTANPTDKGVIVLYNSTQGNAHLSYGDVERQDSNISFPTPGHWNEDDQIHVYFSFVSDDNSASSVYLGQFQV